MSIAKEAIDLYLQGYAMTEIRERLNVSSSTVWYALKRAGYNTEPIPRNDDYILSFAEGWENAVDSIKRGIENRKDMERKRNKIVICR